MERVIEIISIDGYRISNVDVTIIAQKPKLAPFIEYMVKNLAKTAKLDVSQVNVKVDDVVVRGQVIGTSGTCKLYDAESNLHFELTHQGKNVNPELYYNKSTDEL